MFSRQRILNRKTAWAESNRRSQPTAFFIDKITAFDSLANMIEFVQNLCFLRKTKTFDLDKKEDQKSTIKYKILYNYSRLLRCIFIEALMEVGDKIEM